MATAGLEVRGADRVGCPTDAEPPTPVANLHTRPRVTMFIVTCRAAIPLGRSPADRGGPPAPHAQTIGVGRPERTATGPLVPCEDGGAPAARVRVWAWTRSPFIRLRTREPTKSGASLRDATRTRLYSAKGRSRVQCDSSALWLQFRGPEGRQSHRPMWHPRCSRPPQRARIFCSTVVAPRPWKTGLEGQSGAPCAIARRRSRRTESGHTLTEPKNGPRVQREECSVRLGVWANESRESFAGPVP